MSRKKIGNKSLLVIFLLLVVMIFLFTGCSTGNNASPKALYNKNKEIDLFVYENVAYVNASDNEWIRELDLETGKLLGKIQRTGITRKFRDFDATKLEEGTELFLTIRKDIILVLTDEEYIPYYRWTEG